MTDPVVGIEVDDDHPLARGEWLCVPFGAPGGPLTSAHVIPIIELASHELDRGCWCRPHLEDGAANGRLVVAHNDDAARRGSAA